MVIDNGSGSANRSFAIWAAGAATVAAVALGVVVWTSKTPGPEPVPPEPAPSEVTGSLMPYVSASAPATSADGEDNFGNATNYDAQNLLDDDPTTAWRMDGSASGMTLTFTFDQARTVNHLGLINGFAKHDPKDGEDRYVQNRRLLSATWFVGDQTIPQSFIDGDWSVQDITFDPVSTTRVQLYIDAVSYLELGMLDRTAISDVLIENDQFP